MKRISPSVTPAELLQRQVCLTLAVEHYSGKAQISPETVCDTAVLFEYYLENGEYPPG